MQQIKQFVDGIRYRIEFLGLMPPEEDLAADFAKQVPEPVRGERKRGNPVFALERRQIQIHAIRAV